MKTIKQQPLNETSRSFIGKQKGTRKSISQVKDRTGEILFRDKRNNVYYQLGEIVVIKRIIERDGISESEIISELKDFFKILYKNSHAETKIKFEELARNRDNLKNRNSFYKSLYTGENKDLIIPEIEGFSFELIKLIKIHNGIIRLKIKKDEVALLRQFPSVLEVEDLDDFYKRNISSTKYRKTFLRMFGTKKEIEEIFVSELEGENNFNSKDEKIRINRRVQYLTSELKPRKGAFERFSLNMIFDAKKFSEFGTLGSGGLSHLGTIINLIKERTDEKIMDNSIKHESTHNIYNAFFDNTNILEPKFFFDLIIEIRKSLVNSEPDFMVNSYLESLDKGVKRFFDSATPEIIADFRVLNTGKISTAFGSYQILILTLSQIYSVIDKDLGLTTDNKNKLFKIISSFSSKVIKEYKTTYKRLADFVYICEKEGKMDELFSLLLIYGIGKHHKIEKNLKQIIGENKYKYYENMRAVMKPQFFKIPKQDVGGKEDELECAAFNIKRTKKEHEIGVLENPLGFEKLQFLIENPTPEYYYDKNLVNPIVNHFSEYNYSEVFKIDSIDNEEKLIKYLELMKKFLEKLKIKWNSINYILEKIELVYEEYIESLTT